MKSFTPILSDDEDKGGLVWTGDTASGQAYTLSTCQTTQQPLAGTISPEGHRLLQPHHQPEAERRQLTVMFCDLVDSTTLSASSTPKSTGTWSVPIKLACTEVIQRYDGHIAQLLGDGLLVYFGYPQAHEDDAQRAVRAGLGYAGCPWSPQYPSATRETYPPRHPCRSAYGTGWCFKRGYRWKEHLVNQSHRSRHLHF